MIICVVIEWIFKMPTYWIVQEIDHFADTVASEIFSFGSKAFLYALRRYRETHEWDGNDVDENYIERQMIVFDENEKCSMVLCNDSEDTGLYFAIRKLTLHNFDNIPDVKKVYLASEEQRDHDTFPLMHIYADKYDAFECVKLFYSDAEKVSKNYIRSEKERFENKYVTYMNLFKKSKKYKYIVETLFLPEK